MSIPSTLSRRGRRANTEEPPPDGGCQYAPRCTACPWATCIKELPTRERNEFLAALRLVQSYLAAPDRALG